MIVAFFLAAFNGENFSSHGFAPEGVHGVFTAIATSGIVFSFLGFRQGIELAGETDNPKRNVPIAVIGSVLLTGLIYVLLQVAFIGALDPGTLSESAAARLLQERLRPPRCPRHRARAWLARRAALHRRDRLAR